MLTIPQQGVETSTATEAAPPAADQTAQLTLPAGSKRSTSKAIRVQAGDFVLVKVHDGGRGIIQASGKLASKTEGPHYLGASQTPARK